MAGEETDVTNIVLVKRKYWEVIDVLKLYFEVCLITKGSPSLNFFCETSVGSSGCND